jgi:hypothetical protein
MSPSCCLSHPSRYWELSGKAKWRTPHWLSYNPQEAQVLRTCIGRLQYNNNHKFFSLKTWSKWWQLSSSGTISSV